jgi:2-haloacid dehalogenase
MATLNAFRSWIAGPALIVAAVIAFPGAQPSVAHAGSAAAPRFKAIAFDYLVLFNPDSIVAEAEQVFPGKGRELTNLWRTRQFEYGPINKQQHSDREYFIL